MTAEWPRYDTGIESSAAILPGPPPLWSFSSLKEVRVCPRRYALSRASYPDLWDGRGYPRVPALAALFGDVVHDALDTIMKAIVAAGCESAQSPEAVAVLRELGGYTAVIDGAALARMAALQGNPRLSDDMRQRLRRGLYGRIPDARVQVQGYISKSVIAPAATPKAAGKNPAAVGVGGGQGALQPGTYAEVWLAASNLRVTGRLDLLRVTEVEAHITDYKTGAESPAHGEQLRLYALLWDLDRDANPGRRPVASLTAAYPDRAVAIPVPSESELRDMQKQAEASIEEADTEIATAVPRAVPSDENCANCNVRHLCDAYWSAVVPDLSDLPEEARFDVQGIVGARNGPHSWWFHPQGGDRKAVLIQAPPAGPELPSGHRVRILGLRIDADADTKTTVASMNSTTEVFHLS